MDTRRPVVTARARPGRPDRGLSALLPSTQNEQKVNKN